MTWDDQMKNLLIYNHRPAICSLIKRSPFLTPVPCPVPWKKAALRHRMTFSNWASSLAVWSLAKSTTEPLCLQWSNKKTKLNLFWHVCFFNKRKKSNGFETFPTRFPSLFFTFSLKRSPPPKKKQAAQEARRISLKASCEIKITNRWKKKESFEIKLRQWRQETTKRYLKTGHKHMNPSQFWPQVPFHGLCIIFGCFLLIFFLLKKKKHPMPGSPVKP